MGTQARYGRVGVLPGELELDVAVELLEARVAADLRGRRAEEAVQGLLHIGTVHQSASSGRESSESPCSSRCLRSFRRAS